MRLPVRLEALLTRREQPLRFLVAGGLNTLFGLGLYPALLWSSVELRHHYLIALGIAQAISLCFAYTSYKLLVFRTQGRSLREAGTFVSFYLFNFTANWLALPFLVEVARLPPIAAQLSFVVVLTVASYFWHSRLTFRTDRRP